MPELIADRYQIIGTIGAGGAGTVYKVFDPVLNKHFAIKILKHDTDGAKAARLQREAVAAGKLNHPHICRIDNFGQMNDGSPYMVMEFLEGEDLSQYLQKEGALSISIALEIAIQIASALLYAHEHNVIHRDLKPANVLLLKDASEIFVKLLDFGVAKIETQNGDITQTGTIVGSPLYMSPEQITGQEVSKASDIYSFGCMLFEILTANAPFHADSVLEIFSKHKSSEATKLSSYGTFPDALIDLVADCLNKNPEQRPKNFNQILIHLEKIQSEVLNPVVDSKPHNDEKQILEQKNKAKKRIVITVLIVSTMLLAVAFSATFINKDIKSRKVLPESRVSGKSGLDQAADEFFDESRDRKNLFVPDSRNSAFSLRAVPSVVDKDLSLLEGKRIYKLSFDGSQVDGSGLKYVVNSGIRQLRMQQVEVNDENMKYVAMMKDLTSFSLYSDFLTDKGLVYISDARKFDVLELFSDQITNQGIASIKHLDHCTHLSFRGQKLTIDCIKSIGVSKNLKTLELGKFRVEGDLGILLNRFPNLQKMVFADVSSLDPISLLSLSKRKLKTLELIRCDLKTEQLKAICALNDLNSLSLFKCEIDIDGLKYLEQLNNLISFSLTENQNLSGKGTAYICRHKDVQVLNLSKTNINEGDMLLLLTMPSLNLVDVRDCFALPKEAIEKFKGDYSARWHRDCRVEY